MVRVVAALVVLAAVALGAGLYVGAGRGPGPAIEIHEPARFIGRQVELEVTIDPGDAELTAVTAVIEQNGVTVPLFSLSAPDDSRITQETDTRIRISRSLSREAYREIVQGPASIAVEATQTRFFGLRERSAAARHDVEARFTPPRLSIASTFHFVNHGGAELAVYRVNPPDAESGVRVGDRSYRGYPASAAGVDSPDDTLRVALFALLHDQELDTPIRLYARDGAGNEAEAEFDHRVFPSRFRRSRLTVGDRFLARVVPEIVARSAEFASIPLPPDAGRSRSTSPSTAPSGA